MDGSQARALLGVSQFATKDQIRRAFRGAALAAHPDQGGDPRHMRALVLARDLLDATAPSRPPARPVVAGAYGSVSAPVSEFSMTDTTKRAVSTAVTATVAHPSFEQVLSTVVEAMQTPVAA